MRRLAAFLAAACVLQAGPSQAAEGRGFVAVQAGTIHLVEGDRVLANGTVLMRAGRIVGVGTAGEDLELPPDARVVDYGPDAVIVPGLVAAHSALATGRPSRRTADPLLFGLDGFSFHERNARQLSGGVTAAYVTPAERRLLAGVGAVVKLAGRAGEDPGQRVVVESAALHGAIDETARDTPGYWEPPIPATVHEGMGYAKPQLPRSTMGAIAALRELVELGRDPDGDGADEYGEQAGAALGRALEAGTPWRLSAVREGEIQSLLKFARDSGIPLILDKATEAGGLADEIAAAGVSVLFRIPFEPGRAGRDHGKGRDDLWPAFDVPARLVAAGVPVAIYASDAEDLLFAARAGSRGGLAPADALRAVTLTPARIYGAEGRIGSLAEGKDADLCVLNGPPLSEGTSVLATWCAGEPVWKAHEKEAVVLEVGELHLGDGEVLRPGQVLMDGGRIVEVAERVSHPRGATVVRGAAAMPGMIDALGHLGLEGTEKVPGADYPIAAIAAPGDRVDRRVCAAGVTTVVMSPRGAGKGGAPLLAYKPAARDFEGLVVASPAALRFSWTERDRFDSGEDVRATLEKAREYRDEWIEYEEELRRWEEEAASKGPAGQEEGGEAEEEGEEEDEDGKKNGEEDDEDDDKKKKKKKKKDDEEEELEPDPITGLWTADLNRPPRAGSSPAKLRLKLREPGGSAEVEGSLRCDAVSEELVQLEGYWDRDERTLELSGLGAGGWVSVSAEWKEAKLEGSVSVGADEIALSAERVSKEYPMAARPQRRKVKEDDDKKPKPPRKDDKLEPLRSAMEGELTVVVEVGRIGEVVECVDTFERYGIRPVLLGIEEAHKVTAAIRGRIAGLLLPHDVVVWDQKRGTDPRTPYADVQAAGIPTAFHSGAEEGAVDLPLAAQYAVSQGMSPTGALRALCADAAEMMSISSRVGRIAPGLDADVVLLDGPPLAAGTSVRRVWVNGVEVVEEP